MLDKSSTIDSISPKTGWADQKWEGSRRSRRLNRSVKTVEKGKRTGSVNSASSAGLRDFVYVLDSGLEGLLFQNESILNRNFTLILSLWTVIFH